MEKELKNLGNIPITTSILKSLYPEIVGGSQKIMSLERDNKIIRLRRGLYVCNPEITGSTLSTELIANHLYTPSYVSMASALRYYGLIPEEVYTIQSMTSKNSKTYNTPLGRFEYLHICREAFGIGITSILKENYAFVVATPEKALCDLIANSPGVNLRYLNEAREYLEEDIRLEYSDFCNMNPTIFEQYASVGKKSESIRTLLKLLKK